MHVFDQGFAGGFWLGLLLALGLRFVLRWRKDYQLVDAQGNKRKAWHIARGKRGSRDRLLWDSRRARWVQASVLLLSVSHPEQPEVALSLVVCRSAGRLPWYLLTNEAVTNEEEAWQVVFAYVRRWQIEQTWRYDKSELAFQSPRLWHWAEREKLLLMAQLSYAFLLSLLARATTSCGSGSFATIVTALGRTAAKPKHRSIGCAMPSRAYGRSIRPTSRGLRNDHCQTSGFWLLRTTRTVGHPFASLERKRRLRRPSSPSARKAQGRLSYFIKDKTKKRSSLHIHPRRVVNKGVKALPFLHSSHGKGTRSHKN